MQPNTALSPALAATASATELTPTPLAAALSQSGITLPIPFLDLSAQVIRDLPLENVSALQRFIAEAKFKAWPQTLRAPFEALRTVTPKAPKFVLRRLDTNGEGK